MWFVFSYPQREWQLLKSPPMIQRPFESLTMVWGHCVGDLCVRSPVHIDECEWWGLVSRLAFDGYNFMVIEVVSEELVG